MTTPLRLAIFASVSTPAQATVEKDSLPSQLRDGAAFAGQIGASIVATYQIPGHSRQYIFYHDAEADLPPYRQLRADCEARTFDVLWCRARDRLGRTDALIAQVEALVAAAGAEVYSALLPHTLGQGSDASALYLSAVERAQAQVESIQRNTRRDVGIRARIRRGLPQALWPYGYRAVQDDHGRTIAGEFVPGEIEAVQLATGLFLAGCGLHTITARLNATPYRPTRGGPWAITTTRNILYSDFYAGTVYYRDLVVEHSPAFPHLWDEPTHRAILHERARRRRGGKPPVSPISGIIICGRCNGAMDLYKPHRVYLYRCHTHPNRKLFGQACHTNLIPAALLLATVRDLLLSLQDPAALDALLTSSTPDHDHLAAQRAHLLEQITHTKKRRERLALAFSDGTMSPSVYRDADAVLTSDLDTSTAQLHTLDARLATQPSPEDHRAALEALTAHLAADPDWLTTAPVEEARAALHRSGLRLYIENGQIVRLTLSP